MKRRNVWRAAAVYVAAAWALAQGIAQLGPAIDAPPWITRWFLVAACIGFPFWIAFAWFYAWTPQGFKRESAIVDGNSVVHATGRKLDFWIIGIMAVAIVLLVTNTFVLHRDATSVADASAAKALAAKLAKVPQKSVAVLPFANQSGNPKQQYFSDGLAEQLIANLTQVHGLKVIGKYSSFKFRDSKDSPARIGATLGVANLVEGSVQQGGGRLRITVGMIRTRDGVSVWSHTYDKPQKDLFAIQSDIAKAVTAALKIKLAGKVLVNEGRPPSGSLDAYRLMLQGRALGRHENQAGYEHGIPLLEQATRVDPSYAYAWALLANWQLNLGNLYLTGTPQLKAYAAARSALDRATALAPNAPATLIMRGYFLSILDNDQNGALAAFRRVMAKVPGDPTAMAFLAFQLTNTGHLRQAAALFHKVIAADPLRADRYSNLARVLTALGRFTDAERVTRQSLALQANNPRGFMQLAYAYTGDGKFAKAREAVRQALTQAPDLPGAYAQLTYLDALQNDAPAAMRDAERETDAGWKAWALAAARQIAGDMHAADLALTAYIKAYGKPRNDQPADFTGIAELYALRDERDKVFAQLQKAMHDSDTHFQLKLSLLSDPLLMRYKDDPRFTKLCKQLGLPLPGQLPQAVSSVTPPASAGTIP